MTKLRLVIIGAGRRAHETLFPAVHCMRSWTELVGVHARSARDVSAVDGRLSIRTHAYLDGFDPASTDAIIISVGVRQVPEVLRSLERFDTRRLVLMVDTPVLDGRDLAATRLFGRFHDVLASEDTFVLPPYVLVKRLLDEGAIGRLRYVHMLHSGFRHHALASLRQITGDDHPTRMTYTRWNQWAAQLSLVFPGGARATVIQPRRYEFGRFMVVGDAGMIVDYALGHPRALEISYRREGDLYAGLAVDGSPVPSTDLDVAFREGLKGASLQDPSLMNMMKIMGIMELLVGLADERSISRYPAYDAIQNNLSLAMLDRLRVLVDPRVGHGVTTLGAAIRVAGRLMREGPTTVPDLSRADSHRSP